MRAQHGPCCFAGTVTFFAKSSVLINLQEPIVLHTVSLSRRMQSRRYMARAYLLLGKNQPRSSSDMLLALPFAAMLLSSGSFPSDDVICCWHVQCRYIRWLCPGWNVSALSSAIELDLKASFVPSSTPQHNETHTHTQHYPAAHRVLRPTHPRTSSSSKNIPQHVLSHLARRPSASIPTAS